MVFMDTNGNNSDNSSSNIISNNINNNNSNNNNSNNNSFSVINPMDNINSVANTNNNKREFQSGGLNAKEIRRHRQNNLLSLRRKERETKLQQKRQHILARTNINVSSQNNNNNNTEIQSQQGQEQQYHKQNIDGCFSNSGGGLHSGGGLSAAGGLYTSAGLNRNRGADSLNSQPVNNIGGLSDVIKKAAIRLQAINGQQQIHHQIPTINTFSIPTGPATMPKISLPNLNQFNTINENETKEEINTRTTSTRTILQPNDIPLTLEDSNINEILSNAEKHSNKKNKNKRSKSKVKNNSNNYSSAKINKHRTFKYKTNPIAGFDSFDMKLNEIKIRIISRHDSNTCKNSIAHLQITPTELIAEYKNDSEIKTKKNIIPENITTTDYLYLGNVYICIVCGKLECDTWCEGCGRGTHSNHLNDKTEMDQHFCSQCC
eukprot:19432_1